jgi:hypothetical protein
MNLGYVAKAEGKISIGILLKAADIDEAPFLLIIYFMGENVDPNINRERLLYPWVEAANSQVLNVLSDIIGKSIADG